MSVVRFAMLSLALGAVACGGDNSAPRPERVDCRPITPVSDSPDPGSGPVDCNALDGYELYMFDYFEYQFGIDPGLQVVSSHSWYSNSDRTAEQSVVPDDTVPAAEIPNGRCVGAAESVNEPTRCLTPTEARGSCTAPVERESRRAVHVLSGLLTNNGGLLGRDFSKTIGTGDCHFAPGPPEVGPCTYPVLGAGMGSSVAREGSHAIDDFSDWDGIVFWGRVAPGSAAYMRVRAADGTVDDKGCVCNPFTDQNDSSRGCDKWGTYISLDSTFRAYLLPFDQMQQGGWGLKSQKLDLSNLFSFGFEWGRGTWDLWIDDIGFYRRRP